MRKQDIHVGDAYAVVGNHGYGAEHSALRAVVLEPGSDPGWWRVRFDQPMVRAEWSSFYPAAQRPRHKASQEHSVESRCVLAPWPRYVQERATTLEHERLKGEQREREVSQVRRLVEELGQALADKGFAVEPPFCGGQDRYLQHDQLTTIGEVRLAPALLEFVVQAVKDAPAPPEESAVGALLRLESEGL